MSEKKYISTFLLSTGRKSNCMYMHTKVLISKIVKLSKVFRVSQMTDIFLI